MLLQAGAISFLWGALPVLFKHVLNKKYDFKVIYMLSILATAIFVFPIGMYYKDDVQKSIGELDNSAFAWILFGGALNIIAGLMHFNLLQRYDSNIVSALTYSAPLFTLILAYVLFREKITLLSGTGIFLIVAGVIMISMKM